MLPEDHAPSKVHISTPGDCEDEMLYHLVNGRIKGSTTHNVKLDACWTWRKQEFNIWTGYANEGKSEFLKQLSLPKILKDNWKFAFCSPEDYPAHEFFDGMIHTLSGRTTDRDRKGCLDQKTYKEMLYLIRDKIFFVHIDPPHNTVKGVLEEFRMLHETVGLDGCIFDPLLKFARPKNMSERDDLYANYIGSMCVDFARKNDISLHQVMHQLTPKIQEDKTYPEPSMYTMKGGGSWADGCDNVLSIWRPYYAVDKINDEVQFASQKIKKQKLVGIPDKQKMKFERRNNRYIDFETGQPMFDFDKMIYE